MIIECNSLCTIACVHHKPTDSHSYLLYSSKHPSHVKKSIPYSQFLRHGRLCSDDTDFSLKSEEMCNFFDKRGAILLLLFKRAIIPPNKLIDSQHYKRHKERTTIEFHSPSHFNLRHNQAVKSIILKNFKLLQNDPDTGRIFSQRPLISFKRDKNIGNLLVRESGPQIDRRRYRAHLVPELSSSHRLDAIEAKLDELLAACSVIKTLKNETYGLRGVLISLLKRFSGFCKS